MVDSKLLQESNLTARQARRAPIMLYISFHKCRRLAKEGLLNITEDMECKLGLPAPCIRCYPLLYGPPV